MVAGSGSRPSPRWTAGGTRMSWSFRTLPRSRVCPPDLTDRVKALLGYDPVGDCVRRLMVPSCGVAAFISSLEQVQKLARAYSARPPYQSPLVVGIDLRPLAYPHFRGFARYTHEITKALAARPG